MHRHATPTILATMILALGAHAPPNPNPAPGPDPDPIQNRCDELASGIDGTRALNTAISQIRSRCDTLGAVLAADDLARLAAPEGWLAILTLIDRAGADPAIASRLADFPVFAIELGLLADPDRDAPRGVIELADRLARQRPGALAEFPELAAALCVVHDAPERYTRWINENRVRAPDPLAIFDHFTRNAPRLAVHPDTLSPELLVHVVDTTESPEQMRWALARHGASPDIGRRFFEIEYDIAHLRDGATKRVSAAGDYRIESIARHGGVCADQAYFAESVAKACGIPSAYVSARGADVSHAWVGFLETRRQRPAWNFRSGRYEEYRDLRGSLVDPQTRTRVADGRLGLTSGLAGRPDEARRTVRAVTRLVGRMNDGTWNPDPDREPPGARREGTLGERLEMLRAALERCPEVPEAWELVGRMTREFDIPTETLDTWARALETLCGRAHPDFAFDTLADMFRGVDDPHRRLELWEWAYDKYRARPDLASRVRFEQARILERLGEKHRAWTAYQNIVTEFLNEGPMCVTALGAMRDMLKRDDRRAEIIPYLEQTLRRVDRPARMARQFATQSNHYKISLMLAREYRAAGRNHDASAVMRTLGPSP